MSLSSCLGCVEGSLVDEFLSQLEDRRGLRVVLLEFLSLSLSYQPALAEKLVFVSAPDSTVTGCLPLVWNQLNQPETHPLGNRTCFVVCV